MKIAISATAPGLDAEVGPRFGRCQYFVIADPRSIEFETLGNSSVMAAGGAGISTAQMIDGKGEGTVLTGNCGPNAYQTLSAAGLQVVTGISGRIKDAVEAYNAGKLQSSTQPNVVSHYGMGMGVGRGLGSGITPQAAPQVMSPGQEIEMLKSETQMMMQHLTEIQHRIKELEKES